jgi:hypothetical protein
MTYRKNAIFYKNRKFLDFSLVPDFKIRPTYPIPVFHGEAIASGPSLVLPTVSEFERKNEFNQFAIFCLYEVFHKVLSLEP